MKSENTPTAPTAARVLSGLQASQFRTECTEAARDIIRAAHEQNRMLSAAEETRFAAFMAAAARFEREPSKRRAQDLAWKIQEWKLNDVLLTVGLMSRMLTRKQLQEFWKRYHRHCVLNPPPPGCIVDDWPQECRERAQAIN